MRKHRTHQFALQMPAEPVAFAAVPLRLAPAPSNLLTNAAMYTDSGGTIRLRVTSDVEQVRPVQHGHVAGCNS